MTSRSPWPSKVVLPKLAEAPATLLDFMVWRFPRIDREIWIRRFAVGRVLDTEGRPLAPSSPYRAGLEVIYFREVEKEPEVPFREQILLRDETLLVADKPPFLPVAPAGPFVNECLLYRLRRRTGLDQLTPVHRLDLDTAGLVLFTLRSEHRSAYSELFAKGEVERRYLAVAEAPERPTRTSWYRESRIEKGEPWFRMRRVAGTPNAATEVELVDWQDGRALLRLRPRSGKQHQLRLHLAELGLPILHDRYYPTLTPKAPRDFDRPLQLLAQELRFRDPLTGKPVELRSRRRLAWPEASIQAEL